MLAVQLDLFQETTPQDIVEAQIADLKDRQENLRRGLFARHQEMSKLLFNLQNQVEGLQLKIQELRRSA